MSAVVPVAVVFADEAGWPERLARRSRAGFVRGDLHDPDRRGRAAARHERNDRRSGGGLMSTETLASSVASTVADSRSDERRGRRVARAVSGRCAASAPACSAWSASSSPVGVAVDTDDARRQRTRRRSRDRRRGVGVGVSGGHGRHRHPRGGVRRRPVPQAVAAGPGAEPLSDARGQRAAPRVGDVARRRRDLYRDVLGAHPGHRGTRSRHRRRPDGDPQHDGVGLGRRRSRRRSRRRGGPASRCREPSTRHRQRGGRGADRAPQHRAAAVHGPGPRRSVA